MQPGRPGRTTIVEVDRVSTVIHISKIAFWPRENSNPDVTSLWPALADSCATDMTDRLPIGTRQSDYRAVKPNHFTGMVDGSLLVT